MVEKLSDLTLEESAGRLLDKYNTPEELKAFAKAQLKTIVKLQEKAKQLQEDNDRLIKSGASLAQSNGSLLSINHPHGVTDEEAICIMEINKLKNISMAMVLTREECQKLKTYVEALHLIRGGAKGSDESLKSVSTDDLMNEYNAMYKDVTLNGTSSTE
jgi:hypothetical protein